MIFLNIILGFVVMIKPDNFSIA